MILYLKVIKSPSFSRHSPILTFLFLSACYNSTFAVTSRKSGEVHNEWTLCVLCALMLSFGSGVAYYHGVTNYSYMMVRDRGRGENGFGEPRAMTYEECKGLMGHLPFKVNLAR